MVPSFKQKISSLPTPTFKDLSKDASTTSKNNKEIFPIQAFIIMIAKYLNAKR